MAGGIKAHRKHTVKQKSGYLLGKEANLSGLKIRVSTVQFRLSPPSFLSKFHAVKVISTLYLQALYRISLFLKLSVSVPNCDFVSTPFRRLGSTQ